jgi:hypothetical protein
MKKTLIALAVSQLLHRSIPARTLDISIGYRMGAGFAGDVNRMHPASIVPRLMDAANPLRLFGDPCTLGAANSVRGFIATDTALTRIRGVLVRPAVAQINTGGMTQTIGGGTPPQGAAPVDIIEDGYVMVKCNNVAAASPVLGGAVFVWVTASAGADVQGGFRAAASGVNTIAIGNAEWASPPDANGIAELRVWRQS